MSSLLHLLTDKAVAFVLPCGVLSGQCTGFYLAEGLKDALDVVVRQVRVHGGYINAIVCACLLCQLVNDGLRLSDVTWPPYLQHTYQHRGY